MSPALTAQKLHDKWVKLTSNNTALMIAHAEGFKKDGRCTRTDCLSPEFISHAIMVHKGE